MQHRPWPIIILAFAQVAAFFINLWVGARLSNMGLGHFIDVSLTKTGTSNVLILGGMQFLSAFAIISVKKWSFPIFATIQAMNLYQLYSIHHQYPSRFQLPLALLYSISNIVLVGYFLLPAVRAVYFNPRLRWWESKPRFSTNVFAKFTRIEGNKGKKATCIVSTISSEGLYIATTETMEIGQRVSLDFTYLGTHIKDLQGYVAFGTIANKRGYAIRCVDSRHQKDLKQMIKALIRQDRELHPQSLSKDFKTWLREVLNTGYGIVPEVPLKVDTSTAAEVVEVPAEKLEAPRKRAA